MSVFQLIVNIIISVVACSVIGLIMRSVDLPLETLIILLLCVVAVFLTFSQNAAARLGIS